MQSAFTTHPFVKVNQHCLINLVIAFDCGPINTLHIQNGRKNKQQKHSTNSDHTPQFVVVVVVVVVVILVVVVVNSCIYLSIVSYFQRCFNSLTLMTKQWSRNEFHVGGAIFIFLVVYNFSANKACKRCFLLPSTKIAIQV